MPLSIKISCDVCGCTKGATNHWYLAHRSASPALAILPFKLEYAETIQNISILCREGCVHEYIAQHLASLHVCEAAASVSIPPVPSTPDYTVRADHTLETAVASHNRVIDEGYHQEVTGG